MRILIKKYKKSYRINGNYHSYYDSVYLLTAKEDQIGKFLIKCFEKVIRTKKGYIAKGIRDKNIFISRVRNDIKNRDIDNITIVFKRILPTVYKFNVVNDEIKEMLYYVINIIISFLLFPLFNSVIVVIIYVLIMFMIKDKILKMLNEFDIYSYLNNMVASFEKENIEYYLFPTENEIEKEYCVVIESDEETIEKLYDLLKEKYKEYRIVKTRRLPNIGDVGKKCLIVKLKNKINKPSLYRHFLYFFVFLYLFFLLLHIVESMNLPSDVSLLFVPLYVLFVFTLVYLKYKKDKEKEYNYYTNMLKKIENIIKNLN